MVVNVSATSAKNNIFVKHSTRGGCKYFTKNLFFVDATNKFTAIIYTLLSAYTIKHPRAQQHKKLIL
jgi:hypothetical protein